MANVKVSPSVVKVLQIITLDTPVTPDKINAHMGNDYASKHICYLRKLGYVFDTVKNGRTIASYTLTQAPDNDADIRGYVKPVKAYACKTSAAPKAAKAASTEKAEKPVKATKAPAKAKTKKAPAKATQKSPKAPKTKADVKAANLAKLKAVNEKMKAKAKEVETEEDTEEELMEDYSVQTSFSIDDDFDSMEGLNLSELV